LSVNKILDVKGNAYFRQNIFLQNSSKFIGICSFDKIGIGASYPSAQLDVRGVIHAEKIGIGITNPAVPLNVKGVIRAEEVKVCLNQGCDFVFDKNYNLMPLNDLKLFIDENKRLPEVAPAAEMESAGINLSEMNAKLLQKVEELTLYIIQQNEKIEKLEAKMINFANCLIFLTLRL
jgi:hypothetical protein